MSVEALSHFCISRTNGSMNMNMDMISILTKEEKEKFYFLFYPMKKCKTLELSSFGLKDNWLTKNKK
jgi:chlorite dismutase